MWGRKIIYLILILITSYIALMYDGAVPGVVLAFELLLPVIMFAVSFYLKARVRIRLGAGEQVADCDETVKIPITFCNRGIFPVTDAMLRVTVGNCLNGEQESYDINLRAPAKTEVTAPFTFCSTYCGVVQIDFVRLYLFDYFRLFCRKRKQNASAQCIIMPHLLELQVAVTDACRNYDSDSEEYDKQHSGDDPAEIYQIREFRQGDKLSRVHWKMTARLDEMMIKELSRPIGSSVGIYLDLRYETIDEIQSVYDLCYSLSAALLLQECHHRLIWYRQGENPGHEQHLIRNADDLTATMGRLLSTAHRTDRLYWEEFRRSQDSALYRVVAVSCMDPQKDMENFFEQDSSVKSVLTLMQVQELIEI